VLDKSANQQDVEQIIANINPGAGIDRDSGAGIDHDTVEIHESGHADIEDSKKKISYIIKEGTQQVKKTTD